MAAEKNFENRVKKFLKDKGCWTLKTWGGGLQRSGIPDLLVCCKSHFIGVELKAPNGKPSELQLWNLVKIDDAGGFGWLLYPDKFDDFKTFIEGLVDGNYSTAYKAYASGKGWEEIYESVRN